MLSSGTITFDKLAGISRAAGRRKARIYAGDVPTELLLRQTREEGKIPLYDVVNQAGEVQSALGRINFQKARKEARLFAEDLMQQGRLAKDVNAVVMSVTIRSERIKRKSRQREPTEAEAARKAERDAKQVKGAAGRAAGLREELARRWRPWATYIRFSGIGAWPSGHIVACAGCGLTTAASTARGGCDCPRCGGDVGEEWHGERAHLTRAQKRWDCGGCSARIEPKTLYVVLGLRGGPAPKAVDKWPDVRRLCVECFTHSATR